MPKQKFVKTLAVLAPCALLITGLGFAQAQTSEKPAAKPREISQCFRTNDIRGFDNDDRRKLIVETYSGDFYELGLMAGCMDIDHAMKLGFRGRNGSDRVCGGFDAEILYRELGSGRLSRCQVTNVRPFTHEENEARKIEFGRKKPDKG